MNKLVHLGWRENWFLTYIRMSSGQECQTILIKFLLSAVWWDQAVYNSEYGFYTPNAHGFMFLFWSFFPFPTWNSLRIQHSCRALQSPTGPWLKSISWAHAGIEHTGHSRLSKPRGHTSALQIQRNHQVSISAAAARERQPDTAHWIKMKMYCIRSEKRICYMLHPQHHSAFWAESSLNKAIGKHSLPRTEIIRI